MDNPIYNFTYNLNYLWVCDPSQSKVPYNNYICAWQCSLEKITYILCEQGNNRLRTIRHFCLVVKKKGTFVSGKCIPSSCLLSPVMRLHQHNDVCLSRWFPLLTLAIHKGLLAWSSINTLKTDSFWQKLYEHFTKKKNCMSMTHPLSFRRHFNISRLF